MIRTTRTNTEMLAPRYLKPSTRPAQRSPNDRSYLGCVVSMPRVVEMTYPEQATLLRAEADRLEQTITHLRAFQAIQRITADYIERQAGRGEISLCEAALSGMVDLLQRPDQAVALSGVKV